jgi:hypothetical protein
MEPWRNREQAEETVEERLDRLEREEAEAAGEEERNAMADLEAKNADAKMEMAAADALDEIRQRNARIQRAGKEGIDFADYVIRPEDEERERQEREDDEAARQAFANSRANRLLDVLGEESIDCDESDTMAISSNSASTIAGSASGSSGKVDSVQMPPPPPPPPPPSFKKVTKKKKDYAAALGIKKKPSLV